MAKDRADLLVEHLERVVLGKLASAALVDLGGPLRVAGGELVCGKPLDVAGKQVPGHGVELRHQARRQDGQAHDLDEADVLLLDVVVLGVRVEYAQRVLVGGDVAAKCEVGLVELAARVALLVHPAHDGRHGVVARAVRLAGDYAHACVRPGAPHVDDVGGGAEQLVAACAAKAQHRERPLEHGARHARELDHGELARDLGPHHRELMGAALEVVVRQDRAAHDGQVGVGADEVAWHRVNEIEQAGECRTVDVHGAVVRAHGDAVLVEVGVGRVLQAPALAAERDGDNAQVLACGVGAARGARGAAGVALVFDAELAGGVLLAGVLGGACSGDLARVLLGLGEIDGYLQAAPARGRDPLDVLRDGRAANVAGVAAQLVEPAGGGLGALARGELVKAGGDLGGLGHEQAHHAAGRAVASAGGVVRRAVLDGRLRNHGERGVEVKARVRRRFALGKHPALEWGRAGGAGALEHGVV